MPRKNNITKQELDSILNKDSQEVFDILNKTTSEVRPLVKTFTEEVLNDLINVDERKGLKTEYQSRLNYLTRYADLDYLIKQLAKNAVKKQDVMNRMNMSEKVLDCAIEVFSKKKPVPRGKRENKYEGEFVTINKRLHNVTWDARMKIETHWYIPYHMYETLI